MALEKKKLKAFYHFFQTLSLFSRVSLGLENCWANFKIFSRIQDSVGTLRPPQNANLGSGDKSVRADI